LRDERPLDLGPILVLAQASIADPQIGAGEATIVDLLERLPIPVVTIVTVVVVVAVVTRRVLRHAVDQEFGDGLPQALRERA
jgi:hypothetical protein